MDTIDTVRGDIARGWFVVGLLCVVSATMTAAVGHPLVGLVIAGAPVLFLVIQTLIDPRRQAALPSLITAALAFGWVAALLLIQPVESLDNGAVRWAILIATSAYGTTAMIGFLLAISAVMGSKLLGPSSRYRAALWCAVAGVLLIGLAGQWGVLLYTVDRLGRSRLLDGAAVAGVALWVVALGLVGRRLPTFSLAAKFVTAAMGCGAVSSIALGFDQSRGALATVAVLAQIIGLHFGVAAGLQLSLHRLSSTAVSTIRAAPLMVTLGVVPVPSLFVAWLTLDGYRSRAAVSFASVAVSATICAGVWLTVRRDGSRSQRRVDQAASGSLRAAHERGELQMYHQPITRLSDGAVVGSEALLRWCDEGRVRTAFDVLGRASLGGIRRDVERWAIEMAIKDGVKILSWLEADEPYVSFNVSPEQFVEPGLVAWLVAECRLYGCAPDGFVVELTETSGIENWDAACNTVAKLQNAGFLVAVDDFGARHANLVQLQHLDIDIVKIDRELVSGAAASARGRSIAASAGALIRELGVLSITEGVETESELVAIQALGCQFAQGFGIARPMPLDELQRFIAESRGRPEHPDHPPIRFMPKAS
jgi:EAL domain-containing protein (putative c-di-GMP-specific phosphodiesterase class I)